ncbi:Breast cancer type 1 susceptibility protein like protein [Melipona quadrifasciata]|uniref:Breast cancer type 1 susceptibility protein like protein n=1 Tax=Melipona quadrifasciata TaxID=166423 RepID=A0A0M8ZXT1_9HYME|nr:Breast cancer type 1 susceptibility protein like protein [Melipona quadrifasciata]
MGKLSPRDEPLIDGSSSVCEEPGVQIKFPAVDPRTSCYRLDERKSALGYARVTTPSGSGDQQLSDSQQPTTTVTKPISSAKKMYTSAFPKESAPRDSQFSFHVSVEPEAPPPAAPRVLLTPLPAVPPPGPGVLGDPACGCPWPPAPPPPCGNGNPAAFIIYPKQREKPTYAHQIIIVQIWLFAVLFHSSRPRSTRECELSDNTELRRSDVEELARPSCSYIDNSLRESQSTRRRRGQSRRKVRTQTNKAKSTQKGGSTLREYLSKCGLSGIRQLEDSNDFLYEESAETKVHNWLGNLAKNDELDESGKVEIVQPAECNLDDTLTCLISQNNAGNEDEDVEVAVGSVTRNDIDPATKQVQRPCSRNTSNERGSSGRRGRRWSRETKNHSSGMNFSLDNSRPGTSRAMRSSTRSDDSKEKNEEKFMDVHRTSTCEMLSNMQKNWSTVAKFGKEMRTKKKKLMSLNVSIESKKKSRPVDEPTEMNSNADESVRSRVVEDTDERRRRRGNESNEEFVNGKKSLIKRNFVRGGEASPGDIKERSMSEEVPLTDESFVITLQEGRVPVQSLKSCQINTIIGVTEKDPTRANVETNESNNPEEMADGQVDPFDTSLRDRDKIFSQMTVPLSPSELTKPNLIDKRNCPAPMIETIDISSSATNYQTSTPRSKRLSLNRRSTDFKLDSSGSNVSSSIALQSATRDLVRQIESEDVVDKRSSEGVIEKEKHKRSAGDKLSGRRDVVLARDNTSLVTFTKLGKTFRHRRKQVPFLYLGTTRRKAMLSRYPGFHLQKPCNPIDIVDTQDFAMENYLGNNDTQPMDTQPMDEDKKEPESIVEANSSSKMKDPAGVFDNQVDVREENSSGEVAKEIVPVEEPVSSEDIDILFVSLNENRVSDSPRVEQPAKSNRTPIKGTAKMMSPVKNYNVTMLRSVSLEYPTNDNLRTYGITHEPGEPNNEESRSCFSRDFSRTSDTSGSFYVSTRKRKRSNSRGKLCDRTKSSDNDEQDNHSSSGHSFSSQATCIRNSERKNAPPFVNEASLGKRQFESSSPSTKDIDLVSLSSDPDIAANEGKKEKKVYKRILSLESSDGDSVNTGCARNATDKSLASDSASMKRKRAVSPDSVSEDLFAIVNSWTEHDDRYRKKGKLQQTRDFSDSTDASPRSEFENNVSVTSGSSCRDKSANKLSSTLQRRQRSDFLDESNNKERTFSSRRTDQRKSLEVREGLVIDEDSPDFGAMIDEVKVLQNFRQNVPDLMQEDNFDDVIANVNTDTLVNECNNERSRREDFFGRESTECLETSSCERKSKPGRSCVKNPRSSSERVAHVDSNGSNKENKGKTSDIVYNSGDENRNEENPVQVYVNLANEGSRNDKRPEETKSNDCVSNKSSRRYQSNPTTSSGDKKLPVNGNPTNSMVKDTYDQDSLMNITQQYLMIKQFEEDLFGKTESSNVSLARKRRGPQTPTGSKKCSNASAEDVEHSAEEDDIVENTPGTKTKNLETISSQRSSNSKILGKQLPPAVETPGSKNGNSFGSLNTPGSKTNIPPLYQSTPKTCQSNSMKLVSRASKSSPNKGASVQSVQTAPSISKQRYCFLGSGLSFAEVSQLKKLAKTLPDAIYQTQFNENVTHMVVKTDNNNGASKTLKYLQGIAHRKWVVSYQWVLDSLKEKRALNEELYEAVDCITLEAGPRKSRLREKGLFEGFVFLCIGPYDHLSVEDYQDLLRATGAIVVDSLYALADQTSRLKIIVIPEDIYEFQIIEWYKQARAIAIVHEWIVECISQYKLISLYPYLQELSRQDVLTLGYPEYLVEEETCWESSDSTSDV